MKRLTLLLSASAFAVACGNAPQPVQNTNSAAANGERPQTAIAHTTENQKPQMPPAANSGEKTKWSQSGDPIDTKKFDAAIASAEKALAGKPADAAAKKALATAYFERGVALTDARQYASALGDYRRAVKYDPSNAQAKDWIDKIVMIYDGMGKSYPKEGEEPPPLPFEGKK